MIEITEGRIEKWFYEWSKSLFAKTIIWHDGGQSLEDVLFQMGCIFEMLNLCKIRQILER